MILGIGAEAEIFLYASLAGLSVLLAYRVLICVRKIIPHGDILTGLEDFFYWICVSVYLFIKMYETTFGEIRWFFVLGVLSGAAAGKLFMKVPGKIFVKGKKSLEKYKKRR